MMQVRMLIDRWFQNAGAERRLDRGQVYDLPVIVAESLIATGAATEVRERAVVTRAPERKPTGPVETK